MRIVGGGPRHVRVGLMLAPAEDFRDAALPLFEQGIVGALSWSVDLGWSARGIPDWAEALLQAYGDAGRLYGHGVELSILSARLEERQRTWLRRLEREVRARRFVHFTEHFGFMTAGRFTNGTPLPHPRSDEAVALGRSRIDALRAITGLPIGLENLAFAFGRLDVDEQPGFLEALLAPSDGFLLLDVHNLYCQAFNYGLDPIELMERYPLARVRELHVAGGRLSSPTSGPPFRRDGHDDAVPEGAFLLVAHALARCPALEVIVLEQTDHALGTDVEIARFRQDFLRLRALVSAAGRAESEDDGVGEAVGAHDAPGTHDAERAITELADRDALGDREMLARFQSSFLEVLADADAPAPALVSLRAHPDVTSQRAWIDSFELRGLETGIELVRQWGARAWSARPGTMRATVLERAGGPFVERELPMPMPGPGQVRIRVRACGVCGTDVHLWQGRFRVPLPIVGGHEPVGVIEALGEGVALQIGDRVGIPWMQSGCGACAECERGRPKYCARQRSWITSGGGFGERMIAEAAGCVRLPDGLAFELAAPLFCAGFTVMSGYRRARPRKEDRVAVLGLGGLGHLAVQIARAHGHEVIVITRARTKTRDAIALGAHEVIVAREHAGRELARRGGADVVISTTSDAIEAGGAVHGLRPEGRLVVLGLGDRAMPIDTMALLSRQASIVGAMQDAREDLTDLLELAAQGVVRPWIEPHSAHSVQRAMMRLADGRVRYRAVLQWPG